MRYRFLTKSILVFFAVILCFTLCPAEEWAAISPQETEPYLFRANSGAVVEAELGSFSVPENRHRDDSPRITLKYIRFAATCESPGQPIVYLAGGPGGSASGTAQGTRFAMFNELRQLGDVILFDQRGTGLSHRLPDGVTWTIPSDQAATAEFSEQVVLQALADSLAVWRQAGVDLKAYNTEESADDIAALCRVLGAEKLRLVGSSYGTHLALCCLRRHPDRVERAVLAGVEGPDHTLKMPADVQRQLENVQSWLNANPVSRAKYSTFLEELENVIHGLEKAPAVLNGSAGKKVITGFDVQRFVAGSLRGPESISMLPRVVQLMSEGNFAFLGMAHSRLRTGTFEAMPLAMDAGSAATRQRMARIQQQSSTTVLGDAINFPLNVAIPRLGELDLGDDFRSPVASEIAVLAISGTADGRTPPSNALEVLQTLSTGRHLLIHGAGHGDPLFLSSPTIMEVMKRFLQGDAVGNTEVELPAVAFW